MALLKDFSYIKVLLSDHFHIGHSGCDMHACMYVCMYVDGMINPHVMHCHFNKGTYKLMEKNYKNQSSDNYNDNNNTCNNDNFNIELK